MLREFFGSNDIRVAAFAWICAVLLIAHGVWQALLSRAIVAWYGAHDRIPMSVVIPLRPTTLFPPPPGSFYDTVQSAAEVLAQARNSSAAEEAIITQLSIDGRRRVTEELLEFVTLVAPMTAVHPVSRFLRRRFCFVWRMALMRSYTARWVSLQQFNLEGASQRVQEDTARFANAVQGCAADVLDAVLTIAVFAPMLVDLGRKVMPPESIRDVLHVFGDGWMLAVSFVFAAAAWAISLIVAARLVDLEVRNQVTEAELRRRLVLVETFGPTHSVHEVELPAATTTTATTATPDPDADPADPDTSTSVATFKDAYRALRVNYLSLYRNFLAFDAWTGCFSQLMVVLPYVVIAPMLFDLVHPVTLGTLVQSTNVFGKVFEAIAMPAFRWSEVNDFRSVLRRLGEFERAIGGGGTGVRAAPRRTKRRPPSRQDVAIVLATEMSTSTTIHGYATHCDERDDGRAVIEGDE